MQYKIIQALLLAVFFMLAICMAADAEIYKYQDANGNWVFTDSPPQEVKGIEKMDNMIAGADGLTDIAAKLHAAFPPGNEIVRASLAAVSISSPIGTGSGFFISANGHIITNRHVLMGDERQQEAVAERFETVDSHITQADQQVEMEENRLASAREDLDQMKRYLEGLPRGSARRNELESRYQRDLDYVRAWEDRHQRAKEQYLQHKDKYASEKSEYRSKIATAGISRSFKITLKDGTELDAFLVRTSTSHDLALLKVSGCQTPYLRPAASGGLSQGIDVYAIGNPMNLKDSMSKGIISGFRDGFLQTDARIYPGNSGGPLVAADGRVVGVNTMKELTRGFEGLGFAIPIQAVLSEFGDEL